jgi:hypothetical protein
MKNRMLLSIIAVMMAFAVVGCHKKPAPSIDVVNGVTPVSSALSSVRATINELAVMSPAERSARLQHDWPHLGEDVVYYVRAAHEIPSDAVVERVEFFFGSLEHVTAGDLALIQYEGHAKNQLIARLHLRGRATPLDFFVLCLNGMVSPGGAVEHLQTLGSSAPAQRFTIADRQGLVTYVDYPLAISLAERFHLPLYRGRKMAAKDRITPDQARQLEPDTARVQVTVRVCPGDRFDLVAGTYTPAHSLARHHRAAAAAHKTHKSPRKLPAALHKRRRN